ncbi:MAG: MFS transporter [Alphaproteobacteria bacterium]|nr:MFS transporter [Alphaproteobacteria bacterium]
MSGASRPSMLAPFQVRSFRYQWASDLATAGAIEMENIALGWFILVETGSVLALTVFASLQFLGTLLAPFSGLAGDRIGHRRLLCILRTLYLLLAAVLAGFAFAAALGPVPVFAVATLSGLLRPSDLGARTVLISEMMPPGRLLGALGLARITAESARGLGALAGAGTIAALGISRAYLLIVALYALSLALTFMAGSLRPAQMPARVDAAGRRVSVWGDLRAAIGLVWNLPPQLAGMCIAFLINLTAYPFILGLLPYVAREVYGTGQAGLGYLVAAAGVGSVVASLLLSRLQSRVLPARVMILAAIAWNLLDLVLARTTGMAGGVPVLVLIGLVQGACIVTISAVQLQNAPPALRGRIAGLRSLAVYGLPIGLWVSGPVIERWGFAAATTAYGCAGLACTLLVLLVWRRHLWPADSLANRGS